MKTFRLTILFWLTFLSLHAQQHVFTAPVTLAYFPSYSETWTTTNQNSKLREIPSFVNYVFLAFAKPDLTYVKDSYNITGTGIEVPYDGCTLKESVAALKAKGINVILSIGGETYWTPQSYTNINYQQIKDLVDDIGFAGIDWDFEPDGSFQQIGNTTNVQRFITFITNSRALMPKSAGYLIACAPAGVGALGGQINNDTASPFAYSNRNTLTGESDANLYNATVPNNGISLFGFASTGHMIPVFQAVGDKIDIVAYQGYNTGASTNRAIMYDAYAYYAEMYGFKVAAGVHYPNEPWGPYYTYTHQNVADLANHVKNYPSRVGDKDGIMIWQLLLTGTGSSAYSYMNVSQKVLSGIPVANAVADATNYSLSPYTGGAQGCSGGGSQTFCGAAAYNSSQSYPTPNTQVFYQCKIWKNQWWANPNEIPGQNSVWLQVSNCNEGAGCALSTEDFNWESLLDYTVINKKIYVTSKNLSIKGIQLYSLLGNEIYHLENEHKTQVTISGEQWPNGVYFLKVQFENQKETSLKILVQ